MRPAKLRHVYLLHNYYGRTYKWDFPNAHRVIPADSDKKFRSAPNEGRRAGCNLRAPRFPTGENDDFAQHGLLSDTDESLTWYAIPIPWPKPAPKKAPRPKTIERHGAFP